MTKLVNLIIESYYNKIEESEVPANAMGASSSTPGSGGIDTYDPLLKFNDGGTYINKKQKQWMNWAEFNGVAKSDKNIIFKRNRLTK